MNTKLDQFLTISAFTGWVTSIGAMLAIGVNPAQPLPPLSLQAVMTHAQVQAHQSTQSLLDLQVAGINLGTPAFPQKDPPLLLPESGHWLDRSQFSGQPYTLAGISPALTTKTWLAPSY